MCSFNIDHQGWRSTNCSEDVNECLQDVCSKKANSNCTNVPGYFTCDCLHGFKEINGKCEGILQYSDILLPHLVLTALHHTNNIN